MEWKDVRTHYKTLFAKAKDAGETQTTIAARGGIVQPDLSRMLRTGGLGPHVDTLIRAIEGLGLSVSEFFLQIERQTDGDLSARANTVKDAAISPRDKGGPRERASVSAPPDVRAAVSRALFLAAASLTEPESASADERPDRQVRAARATKRRPR